MSSNGRTHSNGQVILTWLGRLFLLAVPLVIVFAFAYPRPVQFLNPVVCDTGLTIQVEANDADWPFDNAVRCGSDTLRVDATGRVVGLAGISFVLAVGCYALRSRITPKPLSAPVQPAHM